MAVKVPVMIDGMYIGKLSEQTVEVLKEIRESKVVPNLKNTILDIPPDLVIRSIGEKTSVREIAKAEGINLGNYCGEMRDYQTVGTAFLYFSPNSMIGDGVGLGKTVEIASLINLLYKRREMNRFLMAVEGGALVQTQCELIKMTGLNIVTLPSEKDKLIRVFNSTDWNKVDGIVVKHTLLRSDTFSKLLAMNINSSGKCNVFDVFILDESSCIKNDNTKMYRYTKNICELADRVHFMNATAFETKILDIYYQIDMMDYSMLPIKSKITSKYCTWERKSYWSSGENGAKLNHGYAISGYKNQEQFKQSLRMCYFGRTKKDVGIDIPHVHKIYTVEPTIKQIMAIGKYSRYNEILNCPSLVKEANINTTIEDVPKIARLVQIIDNEFRDSKVMIYVFHKEAQRAIMEELKKIGRNPLILNGEENDQTAKYKIQQKFNEGDCDVLITNTKKSLNLHGGDACIFYSIITNPATMFQVAGRIDRNVDDRIKTFILMLYDGTEEYNYFKNIVAKRSKDAKDLTIDAKTAVDYFLESMEEKENEK